MTGVVCRGPRTMFVLLGVTTLVLIAGVPGGLRSAAGERRGVPAQAPGTGREAGRGDVGSRRLGRWLGGIRRPSGRPLVIPGRSAQVETDLDSNIEREEVVFKSLPRRLLGAQRTSPRAGGALPAGPPTLGRGLVTHPRGT